jgi:hypothetical protein
VGVSPRLGESAALGALGAVLGAGTGRLVGAAPLGALIGGGNGLVAGWAQVYDGSTRRGRLAFVLDSTWSLTMTAAGLMVHGLSHLRGLGRGGPGYLDSWSRRQNRFVYRQGWSVRRGYAMAIGNVITGAGDPTTGEATSRRRWLVDDHENVHIDQARWFGPLFPLAYGGWSVLAALWAVISWPRVRAQRSLTAHIDALAYRSNPFERWAYAGQARQASLRAAS